MGMMIGYSGLDRAAAALKIAMRAARDMAQATRAEPPATP